MINIKLKQLQLLQLGTPYPSKSSCGNKDPEQSRVSMFNPSMSNNRSQEQSMVICITHYLIEGTHKMQIISQLAAKSLEQSKRNCCELSKLIVYTLTQIRVGCPEQSRVTMFTLALCEYIVLHTHNYITKIY